MTIIVAGPLEVLRIDPTTATFTRASGLDDQRPTFVSADRHTEGRAWLATQGGGVFRTDDEGRSWQATGLEGERLMTVATSRSRRNRIWAGAEPSRIWRSDDAGDTWEPTAALEALNSSPEWAFPPRPETHHVRWIGCHPHDADRLWVAIEAGALVTTDDGGRRWADRVPGGPRDTHELAVHSDAPAVLRVAAGDGYFESRDGGETWARPRTGLEVGYLRSVAIDSGDPGTVLVSASSAARTAYVAGRSDGRVYWRKDEVAVGTTDSAPSPSPWRRVTRGFPATPRTMAPLLIAGWRFGEFWAVDERGLHRSDDGGRTWEEVARFLRTPDHLRGLALLR